MNKRILSILVVLVLSFSVFSLASAEDTSSNDNQTLVVGFDSEFPPFGYEVGNGEYTGFDIELAKEVCNRNNWTFKAQPLTNWNTKDTELNSDLIDCIWSELTINGRENDYTWSKPYFNNSQVVVVKSDSNVNSLNDLKGKVVEVQEGNSVLKNLQNENKSIADSFASLVEIKDYNTGFMDLQSGACDAIIVDIGSAKYQIKEKSGNFRILEEPLSYEQYGIAFKKGNEDLKNQVQKTLDEMHEDGTVNKIAQKYGDYGIMDGLINP